MMEDSDLMPYGKYRGSQMADIPADYLMWLWDNNKCSGKIKEYIQENLNVIKSQISFSKLKAAR